MRGHMTNQYQLDIVLSWFTKYHELKSVGGTRHHQANYSVAQDVAQLPNVAQLSIKVKNGMMGIGGGLISLYHSNYSSSMQRNHHIPLFFFANPQISHPILLHTSCRGRCSQRCAS
jgi:hypothetical protein